MMDYIKQIFEMLGVEPYETFKIQGMKETFVIDNDLNLLLTDERGHFAYYLSISEILRGEYKIIKRIKPTAEEQLAIDYARACGCKWIAKDKNKTVAAFKEKPQKGENGWINTTNNLDDWIELYLPISFIHWEDEEPFFIGDEK